jgi:hypothetical protein
LPEPSPAFDATITCVDCGGVAHLISFFPPDEPPDPTEVVLTYRCADCGDRWDIVPADDTIGEE